MSESRTKQATSYHDRIAQAVAALQGQVVTQADIEQAYATAFPDATRDVQWIRGADHSSDHSNEGSCVCARTSGALFDRVAHGKYLVRKPESGATGDGISR